jgi:hypothetical protein
VLESKATAMKATVKQSEKDLRVVEDEVTKSIAMGGGYGQAAVDAVKIDILTQVRAAIDPFIKLVANTSTSKNDPGGLIMKRV